MTVADPEAIGCQFCGAPAGERCRSSSVRPDGGTMLRPRRDPHALRKADAGLEHAEPGWMPTPDAGAVILDFGAAWRRKRAAENGVDLP